VQRELSRKRTTHETSKSGKRQEHHKKKKKNEQNIIGLANEKKINTSMGEKTKKGDRGGRSGRNGKSGDVPGSTAETKSILRSFGCN